ncbi:phosphotransferase family protein [Estrella lausannensis]|uniref:Aminoglycoside phosphotransferase n=1 Tax=Estrella lausannensis TaxID=483423 RepID=A0A0H5DNA3_9BACT|nr:aminoglycoside phosphotransferase family protein [Estrella lausannensis]CRX37607.1 Aminoglycoside phosphotransferase [Estrella lausannensis]
MDSLISHFRPRLNIPDASFTLIEHDNAMVALVYLVAGEGGQQFILKISPKAEDYKREKLLLNHFSGIIPVPRLFKELEPFDSYPGALLMERIPGTLLTNKTLSEEIAFEAGAILAKIHLFRIHGFGDPVNPETLSLDPKDYFAKKFEEGLSECTGNLSESLLKKCRIYFQEQLPLLDSADGPCIAHRDFRPANILTDGNKITGVIDWAGGRSGFAEEDFCPIEDGSWGMDEKQLQAFRRGYKTVRPLPATDKTLSLMQLSKAIATVGFTVKKGTWNTKNKGTYLRYLRWIELFFLHENNTPTSS